MGDTSVTGGETTYRLGIDVGGTFTDLFLWVSDGRVDTFKVLSTPDDPARGVLDGLRTVAAAEGLSERGYRTLFNCNADAGQTVFHLHAHLLGGRPMGWPPG